MPINDFFGKWKHTKNKSNLIKLQQQLPLFQQYLERHNLSQIINTKAFAANLKKGLFLESNIPIGYGVGSSGALCAAILDKFGIKNEQFSLLELKAIFAKMENFFHGESSGTDPLVSYLNYPILLGDTIQKVQLKKENEQGKGRLFLLDTHIKRDASSFINEFLERCKDFFYDKKCATQLAPLVDNAIHSFLNGQWGLLFDTMHELSLFQYRYFDFMILEAFKNIWLDGLSSDHFKLKICGAGGGGFLLGLSNDYEKTKTALKNHRLFPFYRF